MWFSVFYSRQLVAGMVTKINGDYINRQFELSSYIDEGVTCGDSIQLRLPRSAKEEVRKLTIYTSFIAVKKYLKDR